MTTRRKIVVGADGMADVMVLTDPIPRHLSLVSWGANDRPATSWKSATQSPQQILRSFPEGATDVSKLNLEAVQAFVAETLDAWTASVVNVLQQPLRAAERSAQVQGLTSQAGARVAAFATAIAPILSSVTKTYKTAGLKLPDPPTSSTLQGELDRRQFMSGMEQASGAITDRVISLMRDSGGFATVSEGILSLFGEASTMFMQWAYSMPDGVVGVTTQRSAPAETQKLDKILDLLTTSTENAMNITIADIQRLADENPVGLMTAIKTALETTKVRAPEIATKFAWGDTGVEQEDTAGILASLGGFQGGEAIAQLIAGAVAGIDISSQAERDNVQVAATMRSFVLEHAKAELTENPKGEFAETIKSILAPDIGEAVAASMKMVLQGMAPDDGKSFGLSQFSAVPENSNPDADPFAPDFPSHNFGR